MLSIEQIKSVLEKVIYPATEKNIIDEGLVDDIQIAEKSILISLVFSKPTDPFMNYVKNAIKKELAYCLESDVNIEFLVNRASKPQQQEDSLSLNVKNIIAIASGKGGVGKSTISVSVAISLAKQGYKVGLIDADIFGPSIPKMFGIEGLRPEIVSQDGKDRIIPIERCGVKIVSPGFFIDPKEATIWRGPMASGVLKQLIEQTLWGELDFLLFDMPPGTSDIHLTLVQTLAITGALIITTPQQVAIADARKGIGMFRSSGIDVPILGIVENMAWFTPAELPDNKYYIFGKNGAQELANEMETKVLAQIPLVQSICESADNGKIEELKLDEMLATSFDKLITNFLIAVEERNNNLPPTKHVVVN